MHLPSVSLGRYYSIERRFPRRAISRRRWHSLLFNTRLLIRKFDNISAFSRFRREMGSAPYMDAEHAATIKFQPAMPTLLFTHAKAFCRALSAAAIFDI